MPTRSDFVRSATGATFTLLDSRNTAPSARQVSYTSLAAGGRNTSHPTFRVGRGTPTRSPRHTRTRTLRVSGFDFVEVRGRSLGRVGVAANPDSEQQLHAAVHR